MRLDKYLKVSRLIKRRTVANDACDTEKITVNGKTAKASYNVKIGDLITISFGSKSVTVRVLEIKDTTKKTESAGMYEVVSET
jgi:ribosomal 50S subunit-recycling heat shock protein